MVGTSSGQDAAPLLSVGLPVYNGATVIGAALECLRGQSLPGFEIVISDNGSTDATEAICRAYAAENPNVRYFRQTTNIGAAANFKFVLDQARGSYFHWMGADDIRSPSFLEDNVRFLQSHPDYVASTGRDRFLGASSSEDITFDLVGPPYERFLQLLANASHSHGIFYCVTMTDVLRGCAVVGRTFWAADWAIDLFLASKGQINRNLTSWSAFGKAGASSRRNAYRAFRGHPMEAVLPLYSLSLYAWGLCEGFNFRQKAVVLIKLIGLNARSAYERVFAALYNHYSKVLRPIVRRR
ncbi:glycosyltransferase family 2 protein [Devosia alba]|uniref:glycosyltransferase family 2 protein n=1 Tax=Devosia alba TaxID=3152360 RepID=UPI0032675AD0